MLKYILDGLLHGVGSGLLGLNIRLWLFKPVEILLLEDEPVRSFFDQVILPVQNLGLVITTELVKVPQDFQSPSQISLLDLMHPVLVILV